VAFLFARMSLDTRNLVTRNEDIEFRLIERSLGPVKREDLLQEARRHREFVNQEVSVIEGTSRRGMRII
jgi:hypothetical protein